MGKGAGEETRAAVAPAGPLTGRETALLGEHLQFYRELAEGRRSPSTAAQEHFVAVARGLLDPESEHETAFLKWRSAT